MVNWPYGTCPDCQQRKYREAGWREYPRFQGKKRRQSRRTRSTVRSFKGVKAISRTSHRRCLSSIYDPNLFSFKETEGYLLCSRLRTRVWKRESSLSRRATASANIRRRVKAAAPASAPLAESSGRGENICCDNKWAERLPLCKIIRYNLNQKSDINNWWQKTVSRPNKNGLNWKFTLESWEWRQCWR